MLNQKTPTPTRNARFLRKLSTNNTRHDPFDQRMQLPCPTPERRFPDRTGYGKATAHLSDGSQRRNRNRTLGIARQIEAISAWLKAKSRKRTHTQRSYQREAYGLMACRAFRSKNDGTILASRCSSTKTERARIHKKTRQFTAGFLLLGKRFPG